MFAPGFKKLALVSLLAAAPVAVCHAQQQLVGLWQGTLTGPGGTMHLAWHVSPAPDGSVASAFDNVDEQVLGIQVKSLQLKGSDLTFTIDTTVQQNGQDTPVAGTFKGSLSADGNEISGTWEQTAPQAETDRIELKRTAENGPPAGAQAAATAKTPGIAGDWQGALHAGGTDLHLILHVSAGSDGKLAATLDSVDQGAMGIPVTSITLDGAKVSMTVDAVHGTYEGMLNDDASAMKGTWSQGMPMELNFTRANANAAPKPAPTPAAPTDVDGTWLGTLDLGAVKLRAVFKITNTSDGLIAQMQSPDQSPNWLPVTSVTRNGDTLILDMKAVGAAFEGKLSADKQTIAGTFTQMGNSTPLTLRRVKDTAELERLRPQNPVKPYPYREQDVTYVSAGNTLAGTLTLPSGKGPFPAVLLIAGSGPHDRDETLMGHKPFLVLADYLTRRGIVVLRMDKRGVGQSKGNYAAATTADFADDAQAGVTYLKTLPDVDPRKIGLIGHSEGGIIAPMVAAHDKDVSFVVMMAGSGVPGDQILGEQQRLIALANGEPADKVAEANADEKQILAMVEQGADNAAIEKKIAELSGGKLPAAQIGAQVKTLTSPWFRYFLTYDPAPALRQLKCPVLVLSGSKDLQVPPAQNLPAIRQALAGNKRAEIDEIPGLNHLFQDAKTGSPAEYGEIEETMSPVVLAKMANWIGEQ